MINFQHPAFPDLNNFCNEHLYTTLLSPFRAVDSKGTRKHENRQPKLLKTTVYINFPLIGMFGIHL